MIVIINLNQNDVNLLTKESDPERQEAIAQRAHNYVGWCGRTTKCWRGPENVKRLCFK